MAVPKIKISQARSRRKYFINTRCSTPGTQKCPNCNEICLSHRACSHCKVYKNKHV